MAKKESIWLGKAIGEDYAAAEKYLSLLFERRDVNRLVTGLRNAPTIEHEAKDILRASNLALLDKESPHVAADLKRIRKDKKLSPVLLIRGDARRGVPLTIADGYHRVCASWLWDENMPVACCIINLEPRRRSK